jgi:F-box protein 9
LTRPLAPPAGANNRLDFETIYSFDRELGHALPGGGGGAPHPEEPQGEGESKRHTRGMAPGVFVPWEEVLSTPLNLPGREMDFYLAG